MQGTMFAICDLWRCNVQAFGAFISLTAQIYPQSLQHGLSCAEIFFTDFPSLGLVVGVDNPSPPGHTQFA